MHQYAPLNSINRSLLLQAEYLSYNTGQLHYRTLTSVIQVNLGHVTPMNCEKPKEHIYPVYTLV